MASEQALNRHQKKIKNVNLPKEISLKGNYKKIRTMKTLKTFLLLACLGCMGFIQAQTEPKPTTPVTNNFLDLQATTLGNIFGDSLTGGNGEVNGYLDSLKREWPKNLCYKQKKIPLNKKRSHEKFV